MRGRSVYVILWLVWLGCGAGVLQAQGSANPFELTPRLPHVANQEGLPTNPFDLAREAVAVQVALRPANPFEIDKQGDTATNANGSPFEIVPPVPASASDVEISDRVLETLQHQRNFLLTIILLNILLFAFSVSLFRSVYGKARSAILNDNVLSQLHRERFSGNFGNYLVAYAVSFFIMGTFAYLCGRHFGYVPTSSPLWYWSLSLAGVTGLFLSHHLLLALIGYIFPAGKQTSLYSFAIMLFNIFASLLLIIANVCIAYLPGTATGFAVGASLLAVAGLYGLRMLRGASIGSNFAMKYGLHFLLYLCTVEIMPALLLVKLVQGSIYPA